MAKRAIFLVACTAIAAWPRVRGMRAGAPGTDRLASRARSRLPRSPGTLRITVTDDGIGGANPARASGLAGIERRLGTFDGILAVSSPPGLPTMIVMEVPCALSSLRTSSC